MHNNWYRKTSEQNLRHLQLNVRWDFAAKDACRSVVVDEGLFAQARPATLWLYWRIETNTNASSFSSNTMPPVTFRSACTPEAINGRQKVALVICSSSPEETPKTDPGSDLAFSACQKISYALLRPSKSVKLKNSHQPQKPQLHPQKIRQSFFWQKKSNQNDSGEGHTTPIWVGHENRRPQCVRLHRAFAVVLVLKTCRITKWNFDLLAKPRAKTYPVHHVATRTHTQGDKPTN